jgi:outer membrane lipoprotein SlyB
MTVMTRLLAPVLGLAALAMLPGCQPNVSPDTYSVGGVGQTNRAVRAKVIAVREVKISGSKSGVGGTAGAAAGATAGSAIGGGARSNILGAIGGAVIGGVAGAAIEEGSTRQNGFEYVVETSNGALLTLVQGGEVPFRIGDSVLVLYGSPSRIVADPTASGR